MYQRIVNTFLVLFSFLSFAAYSQKLKFERYTTKDGLLSDEIYNMHQDKKGYIYLFTNYGAMKYNGKEFIPVFKNLSFKESIIYCIYENAQGRKWVANSDKHIYEVINDSAFVVEGTQRKSEELRQRALEIYNIHVDDSLNIYASTQYYTIKFIKARHYESIILNDQMLKDSCTETILRFKNHCISIVNYYKEKVYGLQQHIVKLVDKTGAHKKPEIISYEAISPVKYLKSFGNKTYLSISNRLIRVYEDHTVKEVLKEEVLNFTQDKNNHIWAACYKDGLYEIDENDSVINHYFPDKTVNDVLVDSENGLWISTAGSGIYHCRNLNEFYFDENEPLGKSVTFIKNIQDKLFIGTTNTHVVSIEHGKISTLEKAKHGLKDDPMDMVDLGGRYLICYRLHSEEVIGKRAHELPEVKPVFMPAKIVYLGKDSILLLGRNSIGVLNKALAILNSGVVSKRITLKYKMLFCTQRKHETLIATDQGVFCFKNDSVYQPAWLEQMNGSVIIKISQDFSGNCWFCTKGNGLFKLTNDNKLVHYTTANGLPGNIINDIYFEADGSFFLTNNTGLYYSAEGIQGIFPGMKNIFKGEAQAVLPYEQKIYLCTKAGLIILDSKVLKSKTSQHFNLNCIELNSKKIAAGKLSSLNYQENNLDFKFDVISYAGMKYPLSYKLSGPLADSGKVASDELSFKKLPPGNYVLSVAPVTDDGITNRMILKFTIIPAFWQTIWFKVLWIFLLCVFTVFMIWRLFRYYRQKALKKNEADKVLAEYRLIALKAQINPHFMSNCIAAIQHLIISNKVDEANEYLAKFSFLVRQVLNFSTKSFITLKDEIEMINLYVELEKLRFDKIRFSLQVDESINTDSVLIPPLLLQPIIENAIWHGLLPLGIRRTANLTLTIKHENDFLKIEIEDNGVGRRTDTDKIGNSRDSKGIAITRQRIENLKYIYDFNAADILYEDLVNEEGESAGTKVIIVLPDNL